MTPFLASRAGRLPRLVTLLLPITPIAPTVAIVAIGVIGVIGVVQVSGAAAHAAEPSVQGRSLLGRDLVAQEPSEEQGAAIEAARRELAVAPGDPERVIALGRALSAVWSYREAIDVYSRGLEQHPGNALLYRHRGHRYLSLRDFARAEADLERAGEIDLASPGSLEAGPRFDIWYHLGLARYLQGDFAGAAQAYGTCRDAIAAGDDESLVAVTHWLYMSLRRAGEAEAARAALAGTHAGMQVEENRAYFDLLRLYRGEASVDDVYDPASATPLDLATTGYGVANWWLYGGDEAAARALFEKILAGPYWPAFGHVAAEAEVARLAARAGAGGHG